MTLFDILSHDERILVLPAKGDQVIYTWNQACTFQAWKHSGFKLEIGFGRQWEIDSWVEIDYKKAPENLKSFEAAKEFALRWVLFE